MSPIFCDMTLSFYGLDVASWWSTDALASRLQVVFLCEPSCPLWLMPFSHTYLETR